MGNSKTGHKGIYRCIIPKLKEPERFKVRIHYKGKDVDVGMYRTLEDAIKRKEQYLKDKNILNYEVHGNKSKVKNGKIF